MKTEQEQIEEMARCMGEKNFLCADDCENCIQIPCKCKLVKQSKLLYKAGYRKASEVIDEFLERLKKYIEDRNELLEEDRPKFDEEFVEFGIQMVAAEIRQEVEK